MKNILIVDDSRFMQHMIESYIKDIDGIMKVFMTDKQNEIIEIITDNDIDITIMDIVLDGFSGVDMIDIIKKINPRVKIIMCSSMGQKEFIKKSLEKGAIDFIIKPFTKEDMILRIRNILLK